MHSAELHSAQVFGRRFVLVVGIVALMLTRPVSAQSVEVSGGYARLTDATTSLNTTTDRLPMNGWYLDIARSRRVSVVAAIDGGHGGYAAASAFGYDNEWTDVGVAGGLRVSSRRIARVVPYAQGLVGIFRTAQRYTSGVNGNRYTTATSSLVFQPGVGVNVMVHPRFGVRVAADAKLFPAYDWVDASAGNSMARVSIGGVAMIGSR